MSEPTSILLFEKPQPVVPPDQVERSRALDPGRSFLVQAPAGSGKTYLLTQRFLLLLAQVDKPEEVVAITFTNAAAAEMRHRILDELERAEGAGTQIDSDPESLATLACRALGRSKVMGWKILDQPEQLRITTIDAFCRGLALQCPLGWGMLSGLGGRLDPVESPEELYRTAARRTIDILRTVDSATRKSVESLLLWRDNNWKDVEDLIVKMLGDRNRWYQDFVFARNPNWTALRVHLESGFRRAILRQLTVLGVMLDGLSGSREFALELARSACETPGKSSPLSLAKRAELQAAPFQDGDLEEAAEAYRDLGSFLLKKDGDWRTEKGLNATIGFPTTTAGKAGKQRFGEFVRALEEIPDLRSALAAFQSPIPSRYSEEEWELVRDCFAVLREAAGQLQVVFTETGAVDFTEISQIALSVLAEEDGSPSDFAIQQADGIRHLLVDEFQDTSRKQHQLLSGLIAAWPEREGRSCFCVGDPMQSIYGFREAEVELFERLKTHGLEIAFAEPLLFEPIRLSANFRAQPSLVKDLNHLFRSIFEEDDGSGVRFAAAVPARFGTSLAKTELHLSFTQSRTPKSDEPESPGDPVRTRESQLAEIVALIRTHLARCSALREAGGGEAGKYRIAVLGRTKKSLLVVAEALRNADIGFRAIDLVRLRERPEVLDSLSLARALLNPTDRTAWLGVLRAPWCGLSLEELHLLTSDDDAEINTRSVPELLESRLEELSRRGFFNARAYSAASRVGRVLRKATETRPDTAGTSLGTWLECVWKALGGEATVDAQQRQNLDLLWSCLDELPNGELDLLGPGLDAALNLLFALPDPNASDDFGVQLMTIHKSKGLEFEVVIVPDLEARGKLSEHTMISWLERGLAENDEDGKLTEFLVAPIQPKGEEASVAKKWVDAVKRKRETQELRRLLYVAATRAREELHLFARPRFSINKKNELTLAGSKDSLLWTAWPALQDEVEARFAEWTTAFADASHREPGMVGNVAASGTGNLLQMVKPAEDKIESTVRPTLLKRLPEGYSAPDFTGLGNSDLSRDSSGSGESTLYRRTEGGLHSRVEGTAIHMLLEKLSQLRESMGLGEAIEMLSTTLPTLTAAIRSKGVPKDAAQNLAKSALVAVRRAAADPVVGWIVTPYGEAASETQWTGILRGREWNLRPDRIFFAPSLHSENLEEAAWWIVDFKTSQAHGANLDDQAVRESFLGTHRSQHASQLAAYAHVLRSLKGASISIRTGIYYPRLLIFDFWDA